MEVNPKQIFLWIHFRRKFKLNFEWKKCLQIFKTKKRGTQHSSNRFNIQDDHEGTNDWYAIIDQCNRYGKLRGGEDNWQHHFKNFFQVA